MEVGPKLHPSCNPPQGSWNASIGGCECAGEWYGENCEKKHCADFNAETGAPDCSAHGMCVMGECFCATGWGKAPGSVGANVCKDPVCPVDCGQHGLCKDNLCVCQEGWQGPACREPKCQDDCTGHGTCTFTSANSPPECVCEYGFSPPNCAGVALYQKLAKCPNDCSGQGLCMDGRCLCTAGATGLDCSKVICAPGTNGPNCEYRDCPRDCSGYGVCFNGECACDNDHLGPDCSIPLQCYDACHQVCLGDLAGQRCEFCKGQCLTLASSPAVGKHSPMLARLSTLQTGSHDPHTGSNHTEARTQQKHLRSRHHHHREVSAVQMSHHAPKKAHHEEVSSVRVGHYQPEDMFRV